MPVIARHKHFSAVPAKEKTRHCDGIVTEQFQLQFLKEKRLSKLRLWVVKIVTVTPRPHSVGCGLCGSRWQRDNLDMRYQHVKNQIMRHTKVN